MLRAIIGHTGFVGGNLCSQSAFSHCYNSRNIETIQGETFDEVVCAGMPAAKWIANQRPEEDLAILRRLQQYLDTVQARAFTLISTVDVYPDPNGVDESVSPDLSKAHPYGLHRERLEEFVRGRFPRHLIVRLPALFGRGLKKNVIYDLIHHNQIEKIHPESAYQYYNLKRLTADIEKARASGLDLIHLTSTPIKTGMIAERFFPQIKPIEKNTPPVAYDLRTRHAALWNQNAPYQYPESAVLEDLGQFLQEIDSCA